MPEAGHGVVAQKDLKHELMRKCAARKCTLRRTLSCQWVKSRSQRRRDEEWVVPSDEKDSDNRCGRLFVSDDYGAVRGKY